MLEPRQAAAIGTALGLALGGGIGVALGLHLGRPAPAATPGDAARAASAATADDGERLRALEAEAEWWRVAYEELARSLAADADAGETSPEAPPEPAAEESPDAVAAAPAGSAAFDASALVERGYTEQEVERLRERFEAFELEVLYLGDQARREGWRQKPRYKIGVQMLRDGLRAELGDRDYDAALYASGRNNRVRVADVLAGSAAERAGLRDGDEVISYDGTRIYDAQALVRATGEGEAGSSIDLRVRRGDDELRFTLPRGPIGIRLQPARRPPEGFL